MKQKWFYFAGTHVSSIGHVRWTRAGGNVAVARVGTTLRRFRSVAAAKTALEEYFTHTTQPQPAGEKEKS